MKKILLSLACTVLILSALTGCSGQFSNKALQRLLEADGDFVYLDFTTVKTMEEAELAKDVKVLLFSAKSVEEAEFQYHIAVTDGKDITPLHTDYEPLSLMQNEILTNRPQSLNTDYFNKVAEHLAADSEYFANTDNSAEFLREITGAEGIISTTTARDALTDAARENLYPDANDFWVVFEEDTANPLCYAVKATESVYSWEWLPESQYLTNVSSSDKSELKAAEEKYGAAYADKSVWLAYGIDGGELGTYKTKNELYEAITGSRGDFAEELEAETDGILKFATVADNAPFAYVSDGVLTGADVDIAKAIAEALNMSLETSIISPSAAISGTAKGIYHMATGAFTDDVEEDGILFSDNYYKDYVIVLGEDGGELNDRICAALAELKSDGQLDRIMDKYNKGETPPATSADAAGKAAISYRVRKSADDHQSQIGAFSELENAKKEANNHKEQGYKVYDMEGNLIYTP